MNRNKILPLLLAALILLTACGGHPSQQERGDYVLYFLPAPLAKGESGHGPALDWENYTGQGTPTPEQLLEALLDGPTLEKLSSPFPRGLSLRQCAWDEERTGVLVVSLSEQYGALTDISLTLADYCIVLTLSQLEGVEGVEIRAGGYASDYRSHQVLTREEALLSDVLAGQTSEDS